MVEQLVKLQETINYNIIMKYCKQVRFRDWKQLIFLNNKNLF